MTHTVDLFVFSCSVSGDQFRKQGFRKVFVAARVESNLGEAASVQRCLFRGEEFKGPDADFVFGFCQYLERVCVLNTRRVFMCIHQAIACHMT